MCVCMNASPHVWQPPALGGYTIQPRLNSYPLNPVRNPIRSPPQCATPLSYRHGLGPYGAHKSTVKEHLKVLGHVSFWQ